MSAPNRAAVIGKIHKVLKKHYQPVKPPERTVLETLIYAAVLEGGDFEGADESFAKLQERFFDWNEVRVTTITELAEAIASLRDSSSAAQRVKKTLQAVFEAHYSFDIEALRKQNLGKAIADIEKFSGVSTFGSAYASQNAFDGHAIPLSDGSLDVLFAVGALNDQERTKGECPGLERAIPKNKGSEFFSLLHQLGADFAASPQSNRVKGILAEIEPTAKERIAGWNERKAAEAKVASDKAAAKRAKAREEAAKAAAKPATPTKPTSGKNAPAQSKNSPAAAKNAPAPAEDSSKKKASAEKAKPAKAAEAPKKAEKPAKKPPEVKKSSDKKSDDKSKLAGGSKGLTKRKPK